MAEWKTNQDRATRIATRRTLDLGDWVLVIRTPPLPDTDLKSWTMTGEIWDTRGSIDVLRAQVRRTYTNQNHFGNRVGAMKVHLKAKLDHIRFQEGAKREAPGPSPYVVSTDGTKVLVRIAGEGFLTVDQAKELRDDLKEILGRIASRRSRYAPRTPRKALDG